MNDILEPTITRYDGRGMVAGETWTGVATIADGWIQASCVLHESGIFMLTAGHVVSDLDLDGAEVEFDISGNVLGRDVIGAFNHPGFAITSSGVWDDLGVLVLDRAAPLKADRYSLYREKDEVDREGYLVGFGESSEDGYARRAGKNSIDALGSDPDSFAVRGTLEDQLLFDYDSGFDWDDTLGELLGESRLGLGEEEAMLTSGDSGGGLFLREGESLLAGINSYVTGFYSDSSNSEFGYIGGATRVSSYKDWIDANTGVVQEPQAHASPAPSRDSVPMKVNEGKAVWFLVKLDPPATETCSVEFHTRDGSAEAGYDYIPTQGTITMQPGEMWAEIWVQTLADGLSEGAETFSVVLHNPKGASFPGEKEEITASRTINDDISLTGVTEFSPEIFDMDFA